MSISIPFKAGDFVQLGETVPFNIQANPDFPDETDPVCILTNLGAGGSSAPDTFITVGALPPPNSADTWELAFRWATTGGPAAGSWQIDAFLESVSSVIPNLTVPGFPHIVAAAVVPQHENVVVPVAPHVGGFPGLTFPPGVHLFRLYATLRWLTAPNIVRVAGRVEGPLIEFYVPA